MRGDDDFKQRCPDEYKRLTKFESFMDVIKPSNESYLEFLMEQSGEIDRIAIQWKMAEM